MNPDAAGRQGSKKGLSSDDVKAIKEEVLMALQAAKPAYSRELLATEVANYITQQPANKLLGMLKDDPIITDIVDEIAMLQEEAGEERAQGKALAARVARMEELMEGRARAVAAAQAPVPPQLAELARRFLREDGFVDGRKRGLLQNIADGFRQISSKKEKIQVLRAKQHALNVKQQDLKAEQARLVKLLKETRL
ncbi:hypothetical protein DFQ26_009752 [Actinomortierella ambigua]|nr:hypothetical protein DFQ26_009752 [Actinomortierella ambigua]